MIIVKNVDLFLLLHGLTRQSFTKMPVRAFWSRFLIISARSIALFFVAFLRRTPQFRCIKSERNCFFQTSIVSPFCDSRRTAEYPERAAVGRANHGQRVETIDVDNIVVAAEWPEKLNLQPGIVASFNRKSLPSDAVRFTRFAVQAFIVNPHVTIAVNGVFGEGTGTMLRKTKGNGSDIVPAALVPR